MDVHMQHEEVKMLLQTSNLERINPSTFRELYRLESGVWPTKPVPEDVVKKENIWVGRETNTTQRLLSDMRSTRLRQKCRSTR